MTSPSSPAAELRDWSSLPADLLRSILARLAWSSHPNFAATCRHWRTAVSPFYPAWLIPLLLNAVDVGSTNLRFYSPYHDKNFEVAETTLAAPDAKIFCANGDHLTLCYREEDHDYDCLIFVRANLATGFSQELQPLLVSDTFNFVVDDGDRTVYGIRTFPGSLQIARSIIRRDDGGKSSFLNWEFSESVLEEPEFGISPMTNPVLHRGLLHVLGADGRLAVYDERRHDEGFKILERPVGLIDSHDYFDFELDNLYLFESDDGDDLMAVLVDRRGSPLFVVRLNEDAMEWEKVDNLEGRAVFTGTLRTMMIKTGIEWMRNKIFFPRVHQWPDLVHCELVDRDGELAFVPTSATVVSQDGGAEDGKNVWSCGLGKDESPEFWGSTNFNDSIWVTFNR